MDSHQISAGQHRPCSSAAATNNWGFSEPLFREERNQQGGEEWLRMLSVTPLKDSGQEGNCVWILRSYFPHCHGTLYLSRSHFYLNQAVFIFSTIFSTLQNGSFNRGLDHPRKNRTCLCREEWYKTAYIAGENNKIKNNRMIKWWCLSIYSRHKNVGLSSFAFLGFFLMKVCRTL